MLDERRWHAQHLLRRGRVMEFLTRTLYLAAGVVAILELAAWAAPHLVNWLGGL